MTEKAYRAAGLKLSDPVRLGDMERATEFPLPFSFWRLLRDTSSKHPLTPDSLVYFPGNDRHGIWSAKQMMTVVPPTWAPGYPDMSEKDPDGAGRSRQQSGRDQKSLVPGPARRRRDRSHRAPQDTPFDQRPESSPKEPDAGRGRERTSQQPRSVPRT